MNRTSRIFSFVNFLIIISILISNDIALSDKSRFISQKENIRSIIDVPESVNILSRKQMTTRNISDYPIVQFIEEKMETKDSIVQLDFIISRGEDKSIPFTNITLSGNNIIFQLNETQKYIEVNHSTSGLYNYVLFAENALNNSESDTIQVFFDTDPPILNVTTFEKYSHYGILIEGYENDVYDVGIDIVEIRFETGSSTIIKNLKPYIRQYSNDRLIHIGYNYYPNLSSGNHSVNVIIYDKLGNHAEQSIIMHIPSFIEEIENDNGSYNTLAFPLVGSILILVLFIWKNRESK